MKALPILIAGAVLMVGCASEPQTKPADNRGERAAARSQTDSDGDGVLDTYDAAPNDAAVSSWAEKEKQQAPARAEGKEDVKCDYLLGANGDDYRFVAGGTLENTGEVPLVAKVKVRWMLLGSKAITEQKVVAVPAGMDDEVQISVPATSDQIEAHQSADGDCKVDVEIVGET